MSRAYGGRVDDRVGKDEDKLIEISYHVFEFPSVAVVDG